MLLGLRAKLAEGDPGWNVNQNNRSEKAMYKVWSWLIGSRRLYDLFLRLIGILQKFLPKKDGMIRWLPFPFNGWTMSRDMKPIAEKSFIQGRRKVEN
jgi:L-lactate dehydrogenase complex protein LldF